MSKENLKRFTIIYNDYHNVEVKSVIYEKNEKMALRQAYNEGAAEIIEIRG
jgi:hypothetical protein